MESVLARLDETVAQAPDVPALAAFGRVWRARELAERSARMAAAFARLGVGPDKPLGLLLPPVPTAAMAALAALRCGAPLVACDPLRGEEAIGKELRGLGHGVLVTLDLTRVQDRWLPHLADTELDAVLVDKMAELLPFPRNLLMPLLRGGEIAAVPRDPRTAQLPALIRREPPLAPGAAPFAEAAPRPLAGTVEELLHLAGGARRWLVAQEVVDTRALTALLAPVVAGRETVVLPRLDPRTVAAALHHEQPQVAVISARVADQLVEQPAPSTSGLLIVPPELPEDKARAVAESMDARVAVWPAAA